MQHGSDIPTVPQSVFVNGEEVTEGTFVTLTTDDEGEEAGEVWGVDAFGGRVYVSWPIMNGDRFTGKYDQSWHPVEEIVFER